MLQHSQHRYGCTPSPATRTLNSGPAHLTLLSEVKRKNNRAVWAVVALNSTHAPRPNARRKVVQPRLCLFAESQIEIMENADGPREDPRSNLWVPSGHFYSPIVDPDDEAVRRAFAAERCPEQTLSQFGIDESTLDHWFHLVCAEYVRSPFPEKPMPGSRYYYANPNFPLADALALLAFMRARHPKRFIEVGAGFSSCAAMDISDRLFDGDIDMTFIEPNPEFALGLIGGDPGLRRRFLKTQVQSVPLTVFEGLEAGDILFIDSSHVAKTGSDVVDYTFRILPSLRQHVLVHIHDIFYPFEYPEAWVKEENRSWNEAFLLRAFLHGNSRFRVLYLSDWFFKCRREVLAAAAPRGVGHRGGRLWMETI